MILKRQIIIITAFAIAMGFLESSVVVYLREILYPEGFDFPLSPIPHSLALTEVLREAATLIMLLSIGFLASRRFSTGFAWFIYSFAVWDIFYYVFLKLLLDWPESLLTWDVLFLIPTTWTGPVLTPVLVSLIMIGFALIILVREKRGLTSRIPGKIWAGLTLGSVVLIFAWILDYSRHMLQSSSWSDLLDLKNPQVMDRAMEYQPVSFPWAIFLSGLLIILGAIAWYAGFPHRES